MPVFPADHEWMDTSFQQVSEDDRTVPVFQMLIEEFLAVVQGIMGSCVGELLDFGKPSWAEFISSPTTRKSLEKWSLRFILFFFFCPGEGRPNFFSISNSLSDERRFRGLKAGSWMSLAARLQRGADGCSTGILHIP